MDEAFPPYSHYQNGRLTGRDVEVVALAAERAGISVRLIPFPFKRLLLLLKSGEIDGAAPLFWTADREQYVQYVRQVPIHYSIFSAFKRREKAFEIRGVFDLRGQVIGIQRAFSVGHVFRDARLASLFQVAEADSLPQLTRLLLAGRIDLLVDNRVRVNRFIADHGLGDQISELRHPINWKRPAFLGFARRMEKPTRLFLIGKFNAALAQMRADGLVERRFHRPVAEPRS